MLLLEKITLKNACQHADLSLTLSQGLSAIVGPNGAGKSSILRLVSYGLTGLVDGSWGTQSNLQKDGLLVPGYVLLLLTDSLDIYKIRRYFTDNAKLPDTLYKNSLLLATKRALVDKQLLLLIGINKSVLFQLVWAKQLALDWLLTATAANIDEFLSQVFDLSKLKGLRAVLQQVSGMVYDLPMLVTQQLMASALTEILSRLQLLVELQEQLSSQLLLLSALMILRDQQYNALLSKVPLALYNNRISLIKASIVKLEARKKLLLLSTSKTADISPEYIVQAKLALQQVLNMLQLLKCWLKRESGVKSFMVLQKHRRDEAKLAIDACALKCTRLLRILNSDDTCAFCGSKVSDHLWYVHRQLTMLFGFDPLKEAIGTLTLSINCSLELQKLAYSTIIKVLDKARGVAANILRRKLQLQQRILLLLPMLTALLQYRAVLLDVKWLLRVNQSLQLAQEQLILAKLKPVRTALLLQKLLLLNQQVQTKSRILAQLTGLQKAMHAQILADKAALIKLKARSLQAAINNSAKQILALIRSCFGAQRAQARFVANKIETLNLMLELYCSSSDLPFVLFLLPLSHVFRYHQDLYDHPAGHLSGAQKKIAAMILQICLLAIVRPNIGLQMLDLVDASLDPANRIMLSLMIARLAGSLQGSMLLVTRLEETIAQCAHLILLE